MALGLSNSDANSAPSGVGNENISVAVAWRLCPGGLVIMQVGGQVGRGSAGACRQAAAAVEAGVGGGQVEDQQARARSARPTELH